MQAQVAGALKGRKRREKNSNDLMAELLRDFFEGESGESAAERARQMEDKTRAKLGGTTVAFESDHKKSVKHEKQIDGLLLQVQKRMSRSRNYNSLASIVFFASIYLVVVIMQNKDLQAHNAIQSAFQATILAGLLGASNGMGVDVSSGCVSSADTILDWLQTDFVDRAWDDPICGDGTCEWDGQEYPGFGRFGCIPDCGRYLFTTKITVDLQVLYNASSKAINWNLLKVDPRGRSPNFKWNIYSDTMGDFLLAEDARPEDGSLVIEVPDGEFELHLYQSTKMSEILDITDITVNRPFGPKIDPATVPERVGGLPDFAYGDKREALAAQTEHLNQLMDYCFGGAIDLNTFDWNCMSPFDEHFMKMFGTYGMNGTIKMGNGTKDTVNLVEVPFCEVVSNGRKGMAVNTSLIALTAARTPCPTSRRRGERFVVRKEAAEADKAQYASMREVLERHPTFRKNRDKLRAEQPHLFAPESGPMRKLLSNHSFPDFTVDHWANGMLTGQASCAEHKDCKQGYQPLIDFATGSFSATRNWGGGPGQFCGKAKDCNTCGWCTDHNSAVDGRCPQDLCPGSGGLPECISAELLLQNFRCPDKYKFEVRKFFKDRPTVAGSAKERPRYLTPFNRLVGSVMISLERKNVTSCVAGEGEAYPGVRKTSVISFINATGTESVCLADGANTEPYSVDSVLIPTSSIYNGKASFNQAYNMTVGERADLNGVDAGWGFFNHSYDQLLQKIKDPQEIHPDYAEHFNAYLDSRSTREQATNYITYLREGKFFDDYTSAAKVTFVTFNIDSNVFCHNEYEFTWELGGAIRWQSTMRTVSGPPVYRWGGEGSTNSMQQPLEVLAMIFLAVNCILETKDIVTSFRIMKPQNYFLNAWNCFDWIHFVLMWAGWGYWVTYGDMAWKFKMKDSYPGVHDPFAGMRYFQTNATDEVEFLHFIDDVSALASQFRTYNELVGLSILLFVVRVIKNLDFQEHLGLVSRTIVAAIPNILHFLLLFMLVFFGYAVVGHILFGHLHEPSSTISDSFEFLFLDMLIGYDPSSYRNHFLQSTYREVFYLYEYSFIIILFMVLFNVLLGILIDTYIEVKEQIDQEAPDFIPEAIEILTSNALDFLLDNKKRMPDATLEAILKAHKGGVPSQSQLSNDMAKSTAPPPSIILPGGVEIDASTMKKLVTPFSADKKQQQAMSLQAFAGHDSESDDESQAKPEDAKWVRSDQDGTVKKVLTAVEKLPHNEDEQKMVEDIVERYATESLVEDAKKDEDELLLLQVEHMKRELAMFHAAQIVHKQLLGMDEQLDRMALAVLPPEERLPKPVQFGGKAKHEQLANQIRGLLRVTVVGAKGLPRMDMMGSTDPYALIFLAEPLGEAVTGAVTYRTETVKQSREPTWNADFELPIFAMATTLTVAIFDEDSLTKDDLIGVAHVHLDHVEEWAQQDKWYRLHNPHFSAMSMMSAEVHLKITRLPDAASFTRAQQDSTRGLPSLAENDGQDETHVLPG